MEIITLSSGDDIFRMTTHLDIYFPAFSVLFLVSRVVPDDVPIFDIFKYF